MNTLENNPTESADLTERSATHSWDIEKVDYDDGIRIYIKGAEFPHKGLAKNEVVWSINLLKKFLLEGLKLITKLPSALWSPIKYTEQVMRSFNSIADKLIGPHRLQTNYMCSFSRELQFFLTAFLIELGIGNKITALEALGGKERTLAYGFASNIAQILDTDMAYRWRIQDILSETDPRIFLNDTQNELKRLANLAYDRDDIGSKKRRRVGTLSKRLITIFRYLLLIPRVKKALKKALSMITFNKLQFDEADRYWCSFRIDYDFFGQTADERMKALKDKGYKIPLATPINKEEKTI